MCRPPEPSARDLSAMLAKVPMKVESINGHSFRSTTNSRCPRPSISRANSLSGVLFWKLPLPSTRIQTVSLNSPTWMDDGQLTGGVCLLPKEALLQGNHPPLFNEENPPSRDGPVLVVIIPLDSELSALRAGHLRKLDFLSLHVGPKALLPVFKTDRQLSRGRGPSPPVDRVGVPFALPAFKGIDRPIITAALLYFHPRRVHPAVYGGINQNGEHLLHFKSVVQRQG